MRKLSILLAFAVLSLVSTTAFAQEVKEEVQEVAQDKVEVQISELPEAVTKTLGENYAEYTATKAYKSVLDEKEVYTITLVKEQESVEVLIDADGNVIQKEEEPEE
jgi:hypothetical protein